MKLTKLTYSRLKNNLHKLGKTCTQYVHTCTELEGAFTQLEHTQYVHKYLELRLPFTPALPKLTHTLSLTWIDPHFFECSEHFKPCAILYQSASIMP